MATGRRHYFFVADQVGHEDWSNDQLAFLVRLMAHLHERWARDGLTPGQAGMTRLNFTNLLRITGQQHVGDAVDSLLALAQQVTIRVEINGRLIPIPSAEPMQVESELRAIRGRVLGDTLPIRKRNWCESVSIQWPKYPEFQMLRARPSPDGRPTFAPSGPGPGPGPKDKSMTHTQRRKSRKPRTPKPGGWKTVPEAEDLTDERLEFAKGIGLSTAEAEAAFDEFCDHEFPRLRYDVDKTWRNWARTALKILRKGKR